MDGLVAGVFLPDWSTKLSRPLMMCRVPAGFPSPAEDYVEGRIDLNRDLIKHPLATFYIRVDGDSMIDAGIQPGALLVVDRAAEVHEGHDHRRAGGRRALREAVLHRGRENLFDSGE